VRRSSNIAMTATTTPWQMVVVVLGLHETLQLRPPSPSPLRDVKKKKKRIVTKRCPKAVVPCDVRVVTG